jgi:hypothetical protein
LLDLIKIKSYIIIFVVKRGYSYELITLEKPVEEQPLGIRSSRASRGMLAHSNDYSSNYNNASSLDLNKRGGSFVLPPSEIRTRKWKKKVVNKASFSIKQWIPDSIKPTAALQQQKEIALQQMPLSKKFKKRNVKEKNKRISLKYSS